MNEETIFDHEKLDVYQIELLFVAWGGGIAIRGSERRAGISSRGLRSA